MELHGLDEQSLSLRCTCLVSHIEDPYIEDPEAEGKFNSKLINFQLSVVFILQSNLPNPRSWEEIVPYDNTRECTIYSA